MLLEKSGAGYRRVRSDRRVALQAERVLNQSTSNFGIRTWDSEVMSVVAWFEVWISKGRNRGGTSLTMLNTLFWLRNQTRTSNSINLVLSFKFSKFNYVMTHQLKIRFGLRSSEQLLVGEAGRRSEFERSLRGRIWGESKSESIKNRRRERLTASKWLLGEFEVN